MSGEAFPKKCIALMVVLLVAAAPTVSRRRAKTAGIEFSFELPSNFLIGRFTPGDVFSDAAVFVESSQLGQHALNSIPPGEVPAITFNVITKDHFTFLRSTIPNIEQFRTTIEGREVWQFPAFPGLYGEELFYYVVPIGMGGRSVEIIAQRYYAGKYAEHGPPTHYDLVIERIIATLAR